MGMVCSILECIYKLYLIHEYCPYNEYEYISYMQSIFFIYPDALALIS